jgi:hypothetical protein
VSKKEHCWLVGCTLDVSFTPNAHAIPRTASAYSGPRSHSTSFMATNLMNKSADMPCIVVFCCIYVSQAQFGLTSQTLILAMTEKHPPVMKSVNFHAPCCKAGKSRWFWGPGKICISIKDRPYAIYLSIVLQYLRTRSLLFLDWRPLDRETRAVLFIKKKYGDCFFSLVPSATGLDVLQEMCIGCVAF